MLEEKRFLVDVGLKNLPFPIKVASKKNLESNTVGMISVNARIMQEFEAQWIDKFIQILHSHRNFIGTATLKTNIIDYVKEFDGAPVKIDFDYPFFIEKVTPAAKEKCLVKYQCSYSVKASSIQKPKVTLRIDVPVITTSPESSIGLINRLLGQLSNVTVEIESKKDIFPEDIVEIVDKHALVPIYSFLTPEDKDFVIQKIHKEKKTSVLVVDEIKEELAHNTDILWYSVRCSNFNMLHPYSTVIGTEKSDWVPFSEYSEELDKEMGL